MNKAEVLSRIKGGLIVSCQALENEPLYGADIMAKMAKAAELGGACGIRANYYQDIKAIKEVVNLPVIGLIKKNYEGCPVYITPTMKEVEEVVKAGAEIVAIDATRLLKPDGKTTGHFIKDIKDNFDVIVLADISTYDEAINAQMSGADLISTTLSGYTPYSLQTELPDFELIEKLSKSLTIPLIAEGRMWTPEDVKKAYALGAYSVVVGTAITRPMDITKRFVSALK